MLFNKKFMKNGEKAVCFYGADSYRFGMKGDMFT